MKIYIPAYWESAREMGNELITEAPACRVLSGYICDVDPATIRTVHVAAESTEEDTIILDECRDLRDADRVATARAAEMRDALAREERDWRRMNTPEVIAK